MQRKAVTDHVLRQNDYQTVLKVLGSVSISNLFLMKFLLLKAGFLYEGGESYSHSFPSVLFWLLRYI